MKFKKFMALGLVAAMTATLFAGCGSKGNDSADATQKSDSASADGLVSYSDIVLGETGKDLSATITMFNQNLIMRVLKVMGQIVKEPEKPLKELEILSGRLQQRVSKHQG